MTTYEFTTEEKLVLENLRLKIQMAKMQEQQATQQLAAYIRDLVQQRDIPAGSQVQLSETGIEVHAPPAEVKPPGPATKEAAPNRVLSQAEAQAEKEKAA